MKKTAISQIKLNQQNLISEIIPNFIFNRFDRLYDTYDFWELKSEDNKWIIPVHLDINTHYLYLGVYLADIPQKYIKQFIHNISAHYRNSKRIYLNNSSYKSVYLKEMTAHVIPLQKTQDEFISSLSSKTRKHLKQYARRITDDLGNFEIKHISRENVSRHDAELYFKYKTALYNVPSTYTDPETYLDYYHVTDAYTLKINGETEAIIYTCVTDENVFLENLTYNPELAKYSLGTLLYYNVILDLIDSQKKKLLTGNGSYEYKYRFGAEHITTYSGYIPLCAKDKFLLITMKIAGKLMHSNDKLYAVFSQIKLTSHIKKSSIKKF